MFFRENGAPARLANLGTLVSVLCLLELVLDVVDIGINFASGAEETPCGFPSVFFSALFHIPHRALWKEREAAEVEGRQNESNDEGEFERPNAINSRRPPGGQGSNEEAQHNDHVCEGRYRAAKIGRRILSHIENRDSRGDANGDAE